MKCVIVLFGVWLLSGCEGTLSNGPTNRPSHGDKAFECTMNPLTPGCPQIRE